MRLDYDTALSQDYGVVPLSKKQKSDWSKSPFERKWQKRNILKAGKSLSARTWVFVWQFIKAWGRCSLRRAASLSGIKGNLQISLAFSNEVLTFYILEILYQRVGSFILMTIPLGSESSNISSWCHLNMQPWDNNRNHNEWHIHSMFKFRSSSWGLDATTNSTLITLGGGREPTQNFQKKGLCFYPAFPIGTVRQSHRTGDERS